MTTIKESVSNVTTVSPQPHHHHHHHHVDESEITKKRAFRSIKIRNAAEKILFVVLCLVAIAVVLFVYWIYTTK